MKEKESDWTLQNKIHYISSTKILNFIFSQSKFFFLSTRVYIFSQKIINIKFLLCIYNIIKIFVIQFLLLI